MSAARATRRRRRNRPLIPRVTSDPCAWMLRLAWSRRGGPEGGTRKTSTRLRPDRNDSGGANAEKRSCPSHGNDRETVTTRPLTASARSWRPGPAPEIRPLSCAGSSPAQIDVGELGGRVERRRRPVAVGGAERAHRPADELLVRSDGVEAGAAAARAEEADLARQRGAHATLELGGVEAHRLPRAREHVDRGPPGRRRVLGRAAVDAPRQLDAQLVGDRGQDVDRLHGRVETRPLRCPGALTKSGTGAMSSTFSGVTERPGRPGRRGRTRRGRP